MNFSKQELKELTIKYYKEYSDFSYDLAKKYHHDNQKNLKGAFGDLEGFVLYCLIREFKPKIVYEISPDTGMSTYYILQAIKKNSFGTVYGFEIENTKYSNKVPVLDVIKNNQIDKDLIDKYYKLIIGDATKVCEPKEFGLPDIVLIDSCHEKWFAEWYLKKILPSVKYFTMIQDISYSHSIENSTEAEEVSNFLKNKNFILLDTLKGHFMDITNNHFPIRNFLINSVLIGGSNTNINSDDQIPNKKIYIDTKDDFTKLYNNSLKANLINNSIPGGLSQFSSAYLSKVFSVEDNKFISKYLFNLIIGSIYQSTNKVKSIKVCFINLIKGLKYKKNFSTIYLIIKIIILFPINSSKAIYELILHLIKK